MKFFLCIVFFLLLSLCAWGNTYQIAFQKGDVVILRNGQKVSPPIKFGDRIMVSKGGMVILKTDGLSLKLSGDTVIEAVPQSETTTIQLIRGALVSMVNKKKYQVKVKSSVFGVRGTVFFVSTAENGQTWMCVKEGIVNANNQKSEVDVPAGLGVFVNETELSEPKAFAWTQGINWEMDSSSGLKEHRINIKYDLLENFYD